MITGSNPSTRRLDRAIEQLRLFPAAGGAAVAMLVLVALAIAPGPSSANGETVVAYYSAHGTATLCQAALVGFAVVSFIWFAETFARNTSSGSVAVVGAAATAALYLVAIGAWESLAETYRGVDIVDVPSEGYGDAHVLYDVGVGATHLANFTAAALVAAMAVAQLASPARGRRMGWIGIGFAFVLLVNAPLQIAATSDWSDVVGSVIFVVLLSWILATSVWLVFVMRRTAVPRPAKSVIAAPKTLR
jgi:hypothetical protein